ncbi:MAG: hypothetical protein IPO06_08170 [Leptospiraceae bacterium]|nr:hypothetical protein [Leptospiraceae bacterium]MBP6738499.1 hypothetical protein [Leptospiraceae bacterium]
MKKQNTIFFKGMIAIVVVLLIGLLPFGCSDKKKDNSSSLLGELLLSQNKSSGSAITSSFPNAVTGDTASVQATTSATSVASAATSSATSAVSSVAASVLEPSLQDAIVKSRNSANTRVSFNSTTCNGTSNTVTGTYTTTDRLKNNGHNRASLFFCFSFQSLIKAFHSYSLVRVFF